MNNKNMTALMCLFLRAYHSKQGGVKVTDDEISKKLITDDEYKKVYESLNLGAGFFEIPSETKDCVDFIVNNYLAPSVIARGEFAQRIIKTEKRLGTKQCVMFASGYDSLPYNNGDISFFEIDRPQMIADKLKRLTRSDVNCSNVKYISADFEKDDTMELLKKSGINFKERTLFLFLGISFYLEKEVFFKFISDISECCVEGSGLVFDYYQKTVGNIREKLAFGAGEKMKSFYDYREIEHMLEENGLYIYELLGSKEAEKDFLKKFNDASETKMVYPNDAGCCFAVKKN